MKRKWKVALAGYYGFQNLGDELLLISAIKQLESLGISRSEIVVITAAPDSTTYSQLGVSCVNRWNIWALWKSLSQSETLLFGGGGLFQDVTSLRSCLYYWGIVKIACLTGTTPWAVGQSIGPFSSAIGKFLGANAFSKCKALEVRDELSKRAAESLGLDVELGEDLAFTLGGEQVAEGENILVNFRPWKNTENFILAVRNYTDNMPNVIGVAMAPEDLSLTREIAKKYNFNFKDIVMVSNWNEARELWSGSKMALGMRLHFSLLSLLFGLEQLSYPYDPKVFSFATRWGIPMWDEAQIKPSRASVPIGSTVAMVSENFRNNAKKVMSI